jgi:hypothetical protein
MLLFHTIPPSIPKFAPIQYGCYNRERAYWSFVSLFYTLKYAMFAELPGGKDPLGPLGAT